MDGYSGDRDENDVIRARAHAPAELGRASCDGIARRDQQHAHASARDDVTLGLLTGNLVEGARAKLEAVGIDPQMFAVGAYGTDHELRPELPAIAQRRAREMLGVEFIGSQIVIIGDTPADVQCGRAIGARAIGVATGRYSTGELAAHGAVAAFKDLTETDAVIDAILANR